MLNKCYLRYVIVFLTGFILIIFHTNFSYIYSQNNEKDNEEQENISLKIIRKSLNYPNNFPFEYVPPDTCNIYYFQSKLDITLYIEYPEYYKDDYFPYSEKIDPDAIYIYDSYYVVYYDEDNKIIREDYYEDYELLYYLFKFYRDGLQIRERITYPKQSGKKSVYDYFTHYNENAMVIVKYDNENIDYINIKFNDDNNQTIRSEHYNNRLEKHGIWYYYDENIILIKQEYWKTGKLIKYIIIINIFTIEYYDGKGNNITKEIFDLLDD